MTDEQWNIIDSAVREYEDYGKRVQEYVLFLMGYHTETELRTCIDNVPKQVGLLMEGRYSQSMELLGQLIYYQSLTTDKTYCFL